MIPAKNTSDLDEAAKKYSRCINRIKNKRNRKIDKELKASELNEDEKIRVINSIQTVRDFNAVSIVLDRREIPSEVNRTETFFNFLVINLFQWVIIPLLPENKRYHFHLTVDNRNLSKSHINDLKMVLDTAFCYILNKNVTFDVQYVDSRQYPGVQIADLIANTSFLAYSNRNKVQKLQKHLKKDKYRMMLFPQKYIAGRNTHYF